MVAKKKNDAQGRALRSCTALLSNRIYLKKDLFPKHLTI